MKLKTLLVESNSSKKYQIYHNSYTSAINTALEYIKDSNYEYNDEDVENTIGLGPKKPSSGKTNRFSLELYKNDKLQSKSANIQVYGMGNGRYELNVYIQ
jgi:hypothetical protein